MARNAGVWVGLILLGFSGAIFFQAFSYGYYGSYGPGPGLFPRWLGGGLFVLSILYIIDSIRNGGLDIRELFPKDASLRKVGAVFLALVLFLLIVPFAGYTLASVLMLFLLFIGEYKWYSSLLYSICVSASVFYVFKYLLNVPLPVNFLGI